MAKQQKTNSFTPKSKKSIKRHKKNMSRSEKANYKPSVGQG